MSGFVPSFRVQFLRGSKRANDIYVGPIGEITIDWEKWHIRLHDGETPGGHPIVNEKDLIEIAKNMDLNFDRYDLATKESTGQLDLESHQVFNVPLTSNRTISFVNPPGPDRAMTAVVNFVGGGRTVNWPSGIQWNGGEVPELGSEFTVVVLFWTGSVWVGSVSASK